MKNLNVNERILRFLETGRDITIAQAQSRFGIVNVPARISELRAQGYAIYLNEKVTSNGNVIKAYRLGQPRRFGWDNASFGGRVGQYYA